MDDDELGPTVALYVDDDERQLDLTGQILDRHADAIDLITESSPTAALDVLGERPVECVITDYEMPEMTGLEFTEAVHERDSDLPVILYTGRGDEDIASEAVSTGVADYVQKGSPDQYATLQNRIEREVQRRRAEASHRKSKERYETLVERSHDGICVTREARCSFANERLGTMTGTDPDDLVGRTIEEVVVPEDADAVRSLAADAEGRAVARLQCGSDAVRHGEFTATPITRDGEQAVLWSVRDVTEQRRKERALKTLHGATREFMQATTKREVLKVLVDAAADVLGFSAVGAYRWDDEDGALHPAAWTPDTEELFGRLPSFTGGESLVWDAFVEGDLAMYDDLHGVDGAYNRDTAIRSELIAPLGRHGAFVSGSTAANGFNDEMVECTETLVANATAALDRAERSQELERAERRLKGRNDRLQRLDRINAIIRNTQRGLVRASSRGEIVDSVCTTLTDSDLYRFAWYGRAEEGAGRVVPRAWAGAEDGFLDCLAGLDDDVWESLPVARAARTREPQVTEEILSASAFEPVRKEALRRDYRSAMTIPLTFQGTSFGVLELYTDKPRAFLDRERDVLREVGDNVANAICAVERKRALLSENSVELVFDLNDADDVLFRLARQTGARIELESVATHGDGDWVTYVAVTESSPDAVIEYCRQYPSVDSVRRVGDDDRLELVVTTLPVAAWMAERGATLRSLTATPEAGRVTVTVSRTTSVRSFVDDCSEAFPGMEFVARRDREADGDDRRWSRGVPDDLTEKQCTALEVAFRAGFYDWPRESTGEEVAETLGVSAPTFHRHVREGVRKMLRGPFSDG